MVADPAATPVTTPVTAFTVAAAVLLLLQVPPPVPLLVKPVVAPTHSVEAPVTVPEFGRALMVILADAVAVPQVFVTV